MVSLAVLQPVAVKVLVAVVLVAAQFHCITLAHIRMVEQCKRMVALAVLELIKTAAQVAQVPFGR